MADLTLQSKFFPQRALPGAWCRRLCPVLQDQVLAVMLAAWTARATARSWAARYGRRKRGAPLPLQRAPTAARVAMGYRRCAQLLRAGLRNSGIPAPAESLRSLRDRRCDLSVAVDEPPQQPASLLGHRQRQVLHQPVSASLSGLDLPGIRALGRPGLLGGLGLHLRGQPAMGGEPARTPRPPSTTRSPPASAAIFSASRCFAWPACCWNRRDSRHPAWWRELGAALISPADRIQSPGLRPALRPGLPQL